MNSAIYEHALNFYNSLLESSKEEEVQDGITVPVFRGQITKAYRSLGVSQAYYSQVRRALIELGCISILQQGARDRKSVV